MSKTHDGYSMDHPLVLNLPWPPTVNSYYRRVGSKTLISAKGRQYKRNVKDVVKGRFHGNVQPMNGRLRVLVKLYAPTRQKYDIDNRAKALLDSLTNAKVWFDDEQVDMLTLERCKPFKGGFATVIIWPLDGVE